LLSRPARFCAYALLGLIGASLFARPFISSWSLWSWAPTARAELERAEVNADLAAISEHGLTLRMQGNRPISVILPPVAWESDTSPVVRVHLALSPADSSELESTPVVIRMLWQESPGKAYRFTEHAANLSVAPTVIEMPLPIAPVLVHRLGVLVAGRNRPLVTVRLVKLEMPDLSAAQRIALAWRTFTEPEPIANHSVNFLRGPTILGRSLNGMLLLLTLTGIGAAGALAAARRRPMTRRGIIAPLLVAWLVVDGWATWNLARQGRDEREAFAVLTPEQQMARVWGEDIAWSAEAMRRHAQPGATYAVVADDPFYPAHRLDYLLAPIHRRVDDPAQADYVAVIRATGEPVEALLKPNSPYERVASMDSDILLLRRRVAR
jgi:hypothetical protein